MNTKETSVCKKKKIVFLTGTRADYGKLKSLIRILNNNDNFEVHIFATGMHMLARYGSTYKEIIKDGFPNIYTFVNQNSSTGMDIALSNTITGFSNYINELSPDAIVVHGDRLEALAGAIVGAFHNIRVFHIEGGEVSGTIDESIRHAISKFSHFHFVANEDAKKRIMQLGEPAEHIFIFGSPDIDIMNSKALPSLEEVKKYYELPFESYNIVLYHPVTTEVDKTTEKAKCLVHTLLESKENYVIIYPNNDAGSNQILSVYDELKMLPQFRIIPSMRFEYFLTLLRYTDCIIGNSSSGIREACIYGIPTIDLGSRQTGRYNRKRNPHITHMEEEDFTVDSLQIARENKIEPSSSFGNGDSDRIFEEILTDDYIWTTTIQKNFIDIDL